MRTPQILGVGALACAIVVITNAGPLDPPAGPVESTYKTLDEVEARTPISNTGSSFSPINIGSPGSYYLTEDIVKRNTGISITAPGVTLDLNGFRVRSNGLNPTEPAEGISIAIGTPGSIGDTIIRNGFIEGFETIGIRQIGPDATLVVEDVVVSDCGDGVFVQGGATVRDCVVRDGPNHTPLRGIRIDGEALVESCRVVGADNEGISVSHGAVRGCTVDCADRSLRGITGQGSGDASLVIEACAVRSSRGNGYVVIGRPTVLRDCTADACAGGGFRVSGARCVFDGCVSEGATGEGISTTVPIAGFTVENDCVFRGCVSTNNVEGGFFSVESCVFESCVARTNGGPGFTCDFDGSFTACTAVDNADDGFDVGERATLIGCTSNANTGRGFLASLRSSFESCNAHNNTLDGFTTGSLATLSGCAAHDNVFDGFAMGAACIATSCNAVSNDENGFIMSSDCRVTGCLADGNGGGPAGGNFAGISATSDCTIDGNTVTDNPIGIRSSLTSASLVVRNAAAGNSMNYDLGAADAGPQSTDPMTATNPWSNFSY